MRLRLPVDFTADVLRDLHDKLLEPVGRLPPAE
jgi:hypothetical protein